MSSALINFKNTKSMELHSKSIHNHSHQEQSINKLPKIKKVSESTGRKSKSFHRCTSCKVIDDHSAKENIEKPKVRDKLQIKNTKSLLFS